MDTAKQIFQNIQDGSLDLNAAESGVQHKPMGGNGNAGATGANATKSLTAAAASNKESCNC